MRTATLQSVPPGVEPASQVLLRPRRTWLVAVLIPPLFAAAVLAVGLHSNAFEYDSDEGLNLMKAQLVAHGYPLYRVVRDDQPPLFTYLLVGAFRVVGPSVLASRCLVLAFATALLWATYYIVRAFEGELTAVLAILFLATTAWFARLSFSVMIGLPSMAMAVIALALLVGYRQRDRAALLVLSALAMAASLQIKYSSITALPAFAIVSLMRLHDQPQRPARTKSLGALLMWAAIVAMVCGAVAWWSGQVFEQVVTSHRRAAALEGAKHKIEFFELMKRDIDLLFLSLVMSGLIVPLADKPGGYRLRQLLPLIWAGAAALALQFHAPVWPHHVLLIAVPFAWSAAIGLRPLAMHAWKMFHGQRPKWGRTDATSFSVPSVMIVALTAGFFCFKIYSRGARLVDQGGNTWEVVDEMRKYPQTRYVLADRFMYPFRAGMLCCPRLSTAMEKREVLDSQRDEAVLSDLKEFRPEQIAIGRRRYGPAVMQHIGANYTLTNSKSVLQNSKHPCEHYVRNDLLQ